MDPMLVGIGGALGAICRYGIGQALRKRRFPWATLIVNALGSFGLGAVIAAADDTGIVLLVGVGFCGAFTTFSSFSFETVELWERGNRASATVNAVANLLLSLSAFGAAWSLFG